MGYKTLVVASSGGGGGGGTTETASNVGGGLEVFKEKLVLDFQFRTLTAAAPLAIAQNVDTLSFSIDLATNAASGIMSAADKAKLDGIADNATSVDDAYIRAEIEAMLVAGTNVTLTPSGTGASRQVTIAATGGGVSLADAVAFAGTAKTLALTDINTLQDCTSASAVTITIPAQATVAWTDDAEIHIRWGGTGIVSIAAAAGVSVAPLTSPVTLAGPGAIVTLKRLGADSWAIIGAVATNGIPTTDVNAIVVSGDYKASGTATGLPATNVLGYNVTYQGDANFGTMIIYSYDAQRIFYRRRQSGSWLTWSEVWTSNGSITQGGSSSYSAVTVSRLDQSGAGNNDRALMDVRTSGGDARFLYNDPAIPITRGITIPRTGQPSWWDGSTFFNLLTGEHGGQLIRDTAVLGFGTGSGGSVTQATSKTTAVTLNKPSGRITTAADALAAGASAAFQLNNSSIGANDTVIVNISGTTVSYRVEVLSVTAGVVRIRLTNTSAGALSEAVPINFSVIKGAIA